MSVTGENEIVLAAQSEALAEPKLRRSVREAGRESARLRWERENRLGEQVARALAGLEPAETDRANELRAVVQQALGGLSPNARRAYLTDAQHFVAYLAECGQDLATCRFDDLRGYLESLAAPVDASGMGYRKSTVNRRLSVVRRLLTEAHSRHLRSDNPALLLRNVRTSTDDTEEVGRALTEPELALFLDAVDRASLTGQRDYALLLLAVRTGLRRSEIVALRVGDLYRKDSQPHARVVRGKGGKSRNVRLLPAVWQALQDWREAAQLLRPGMVETPESPLFAKIYRNEKSISAQPLSTDAVREIVVRYADAVFSQLSETDTLPQWPGRRKALLAPHDLRRTFITLALEAGAPLQAVQYAVGHSAPQTTERYVKRKDQQAALAFDLLEKAITEG